MLLLALASAYVSPAQRVTDSEPAAAFSSDNETQVLLIGGIVIGVTITTVVVVFIRKWGLRNALHGLLTSLLGELAWLPLKVISWLKWIFFHITLLISLPALMELVLLMSKHLPVTGRYVVVSCCLLIVLYVFLRHILRKEFYQSFDVFDLDSAYLPLVLHVSLWWVAVMCFGSFTALLYDDGLLRLTSNAGVAFTKDLFERFYFWQTLNLVPQLNITETFNWPKPFEHTDNYTPWLVFAFKVIIAYLIIRGVYRWVEWKSKQQQHTGYKIIDGDKLYYETAGTGEVVVLVHGMALDRRMWDSAFHTLARFYKVLRYDMRGFGKSSCISSASDYTHQGDLNRLMQHLEIPRAHVVGFAMGARVVLDFASAYPSKVNSMTLVSPLLRGYLPTSPSLADMHTVARTWGTKLANLYWLHKHMMPHGAHQKQYLFARMKAGVLSNVISVASDYVRLARILSQYHAQLIHTVSSYPGTHWITSRDHLEATPLSPENLKAISPFTFIVYGEHDSTEVKNDVRAIEKALNHDNNNKRCYVREQQRAGHFLSLHYNISSNIKRLDSWLMASLSFHMPEEQTGETN